MENIQKHRFAALDAWRGICALLVALMHFCAWWPLKAPAFILNSWILVDFFFVLSGFVIMHAYGTRVRDGSSAAIFMVRRFGRLWPLNAAMLLVLVVFEVTRVIAAHHGEPLATRPFSGPTDPDYILPNLFLLQAFIPLSWVEPSWSIGTEFVAYIVFCFVIIQFGISKMRGAALATIIVIASAVILTFVPVQIDGGLDASRLFRCLLGFAFGCFSYLLFRNGRSIVGNTATKILAVIVAVVFVSFDVALRAPVVTPVVFAFVILAFAAERGTVSKVMKTRPMQAIGEWSYSIYLVHMPLFVIGFSVLKRLGVEPGQGSILKGYCVGATLIAALLFASYVTYRFIEAPGRTYFNALARKLSSRRERPIVDLPS